MIRNVLEFDNALMNLRCKQISNVKFTALYETYNTNEIDVFLRQQQTTQHTELICNFGRET